MAPDAFPTFLNAPPSSNTALATLSESLRLWFTARYGTPTAAQRCAWPILRDGNNLLLIAPTGNGKTLAALLPIVDRLIAAPIAAGIRCLYVAPLKALVADAGRNLRGCLEQLDCPAVSVGERTGDTPPRERRDLRRQPPDILLTTPESLALLLSQPFAHDLFHSLRWIVIDEIHALAARKRGADLALSLERVTALASETPQRIGLSATCTPAALAARFLVGIDRPCTVAVVPDAADLELTVEPLPALGFMAALLDRLAPELQANRTTLVFANRRGLAERLVWALRRRFPGWAEVIAVHHSSLARARRRLVEKQMKQGQLRAVVSSTSLELGIDIGSVDGVVLVHPAGGVVRLLQRVGRAGHGPGRRRSGLVLTANPAELLEAAVTNASGRAAQCEPLCVPDAPLDVLCQHLVGMAAQRRWHPDEAYALARRAWSFRALPRADFDACLDYLSGRHRDGSVWLPSRLRWHGDEFAIVDIATARMLRRNLGTIVADEPRPVCIRDTRPTDDDLAPSAPIAVGHVDDAFADRLLPGDRFLLDGRCFEYRASDGLSLLVDEVVGTPRTPQWQGNGWPLAPDLARRLYLLRIQAAEALRDGPRMLHALLRDDYRLGAEAAALLMDLFQCQEAVSEIPDDGTCLVEVIGHDSGCDCYVHTPLNRCGNDALARVAVRRLTRRRPGRGYSLVADLGFVLSVEGFDLTPNEFVELLAPEQFAEDLTAAVAGSDSLRERFRAVALTGLMLLRNPLGRKRRVGGRDWAERRLFEQVASVDADFVLLRQAKGEMLAEVVDAAAGQRYAEGLSRLNIRWRYLTSPSPLASSWTQAGAGPTESAESPAEALHRLHARLMESTTR